MPVRNLPVKNTCSRKSEDNAICCERGQQLQQILWRKVTALETNLFSPVGLYFTGYCAGNRLVNHNFATRPQQQNHAQTTSNGYRKTHAFTLDFEGSWKYKILSAFATNRLQLKTIRKNLQKLWISVVRLSDNINVAGFSCTDTCQNIILQGCAQACKRKYFPIFALASKH